MGRAAGLDDHVLRVALVFGGHEPDAAFLQQPANDAVDGPGHDLEHVAFGAAAPVNPAQADLDHVAVQHRTHFIGGEIDVGLAVVALHEPVSVAVTLHHAINFF